MRDLVIQNLQHYMRVRDVANPTELARLAGVSQSVLSRFMAGVHESISLEAIEKMAVTLDVEPSQLLARTPLSTDARTLNVLTAMESLPEWGKDAIAASAAAMLQTASTPPSKSSH